MKLIKVFILLILLTLFSCSPVAYESSNLLKPFSQEKQVYSASYYDDLVDKINSTFQKVGITKGFVQEEDGKIVLKGTYRNYDEFLSAYMIAQAIAGVNKVSPVYDVVKSNIVERNLELCVAYTMLGYSEKCPSAVPYTGGGRRTRYKKYALLIGVGRFKYNINPLGYAPINDVNLVKKVLEKRGYKVYTLSNEEATRENVLRTIRRIVEEIPNGGTFFFYASTHGAPKSPDGETGIVLYDTSVEGEACQTLKNARVSDSYTRDIVITANRMCNFLVNSLTLTEDIIPILEASGKRIRFISSLDVCYSGRALKPYLGNLIDEVYATDKESALRISGIFPYEMIYISSASGNQRSLQAKVNGKTHGLFTYYYYTALPKERFDTYRTYLKVKPKVIKESGNYCRLIKRSLSQTKCDENGQNPLYIKNKTRVNPIL